MIDRLHLARSQFGGEHDLLSVHFEERNHYRIFVPKDASLRQLKELILLRAYERMGLNVAHVRGLVVDAGAKIGVFSLMMAAHASQIIALEPNPVCHSLLKRNIIGNEVQNINPLPLALRSKHGLVGMRIEGGKGAGNDYFVDGITLADLVACYGEIDLLKLDMNGVGADVLLAADISVLRCIHQIIGKLHLQNGQRRRAGLVAEKLHLAGFDVMVDSGRQYRPRDAFRLIDNWSRVHASLRLKLALLADVLMPSARLPTRAGVKCARCMFAQRV